MRGRPNGSARALRTRSWPGAVLALFLLAAACAGQEGTGTGAGAADEPPEQPVTIRMGSFVPGFEVLYVMEQMPEVAPNLGTWYEIEWSRLQAPEFARSVAAGVLDAGPLAPVAVANAVEQGADLVITGEYVEFREPYASVTWLVTTASGITTAADLEGRTVATLAPGQLLDVIQDTYIRRASGLEPDVDYGKVVIPFPQMRAALLSGQVEMGLFTPPFLQQALATGEVRPLFDALDVGPEFVVGVQVFRRDFVQEHRTVVEKFMQDWAAVWEFVEDPANRADMLDVISAATEVPVAVLEEYALTEDDLYRPPGGALNLAGVQETWDFFREEGPLRADLDVADHVIPELLPPGSG